MLFTGRLLGPLRDCLDLLLPPACHLCDKLLDGDHAGVGFCRDCRSAIRPLGAACLRCNLPLTRFDAQAHTCEACLRHPPAFAAVTSLGHHAGSLKTAIHALKYRHQLHLAMPLGRLLAERLATALPTVHFDLIVPVPLHTARLRQRGFNQALEIARPVARQFGLPLAVHTLYRTRPTATQQGLTRTARRDNVRGAFRCDADLHKLRVLLIDDVMTSGATIRGCSEALHRAGSSEIHVAVLGRA